jgi:hypothetical protein
MTNDEWAEIKKELEGLYTKEKPCPSCGACPTCGRRQSTYPYWPNTTGPTWVADMTGTQMSTTGQQFMNGVANGQAQEG